MSKAQGEVMERKMKLDAKKRQLSLVENKLQKVDDKYRATEKERLRVEEELIITKVYFEEFKQRPDEEKWSLGSSKSSTKSLSVSKEGGQGIEGIALITEEKVLAIGKKTEASRKLRAAKQDLSRAVHETKLKVEHYTKIKNSAEEKVKAAEARLRRAREETESSQMLRKKMEPEAKRER